MNTFTLTVLIPSYRPGKELKELLRRLSRQKKRPDRVLILNTEEAYFPSGIIDEFRDRFPVFSVFHIDRLRSPPVRTGFSRSVSGTGR